MEANRFLSLTIIVLITSIGGLFAQEFQTVEEETNDKVGLSLLQESIDMGISNGGYLLPEPNGYNKFIRAIEILGDEHPEILYNLAMGLQVHIDDTNFHDGYANMADLWYFGTKFLKQAKKDDIRKIRVNTLINKYILEDVIEKHNDGSIKKVLLSFIVLEGGMSPYAEYYVITFDQKNNVKELLNGSLSFSTLGSHPIKNYYKNNRQYFFTDLDKIPEDEEKPKLIKFQSGPIDFRGYNGNGNLLFSKIAIE